jgi:hypothetical protein
MQQAMSTLIAFSEKERQYHQNQARQEYLREQRTIQYELEQAEKAAQELTRGAKRKLKQRAESEKQRAEAAFEEIERLKALLANKAH